MQITEYDEASLISVPINKAFLDVVNITVPNNTKSNTLCISFLKTDVDLSEEISLNNINDFISALGGNLGLFTGFSFLSVLLTLAELSQKFPSKCFTK